MQPCERVLPKFTPASVTCKATRWQQGLADGDTDTTETWKWTENQKVVWGYISWEAFRNFR